MVFTELGLISLIGVKT